MYHALQRAALPALKTLGSGPGPIAWTCGGAPEGIAIGARGRQGIPGAISGPIAGGWKQG
jgi:hypothetical protein